MIIKHEANDKKTTEFMEAFMKKNQKNYQNKNENKNDPLMETINNLFPVGKEMTPEDIDIIMDMIVNMSPIRRTPEELAAIRKEIEFGLILANADVDENVEQLYKLKEHFIAGVTQIPDIKINGLTGKNSAPHIVSVSIRGIRSEVMLHALEEKGIYVSAGSACASNKPQTSDTLKAIGVEKELLDSTIRFSFSEFTTLEEIDYTLKAMQEIIPMLRRYIRH